MKKPYPLYVRYDEGIGKPMVLLHGINGDGTQWDKILPLLTQHHRVIVVDVLGHGKSPRPKNCSYTPEDHALALRAALETHQATQQLTVVGYSMGGAVALSYCAQYPDDIEQLYLVSTPFYLTPEQMIQNRYTASLIMIKLSSALYRLTETILARSPRSEKILHLMDSSDIFHKMIGAYDNSLDATVIRKNIENMVRNFDFAGRLSKIPAPITYMAGKKDPFVVQGQVYALQQYAPYMEIKRLGIIKMDHMLVQNLPKEIAGLISNNARSLLNIGSDSGSGPVLVLLHGIESSTSYWEPLVPSLSEHWRVITIDLLGFGKSPRPNNIAYSLDDYCSYLHATIQHLNISSFSIAGHSLGSIVALGYVVRYPERVKRVYIFSPVLLPDISKKKKRLLHRIQRNTYLPDTSILYAQAAEVLGDARLQRFIPTTRTIENTINVFNWQLAAKKLRKIPITCMYGSNDPLVDETSISEFATLHTNTNVVLLDGQSHNFPYFAPQLILQSVDGNKNHVHKPKKGTMKLPSFLREFMLLIIPVMVAKSLVFLSLGLLLFSRLAPYVLVLLLVTYMLYNGYRTIQGAFSLKNEGLSYIAYVLFGVASYGIGILLFRNPELSLRITVFTICVIAAIIGLSRLLVAAFWAHSRHIRRFLIFTGLPLSIFGIAALGGSVRSVYIVVYILAVVLLLQGFRYGLAATGTFVMAFIRSFTYQSVKH